MLQEEVAIIWAEATGILRNAGFYIGEINNISEADNVRNVAKCFW